MLYQTKTFSKYVVTVILKNAKMKIFNQMVALIFKPIFVFYIEKQRKYYPCAIILIVVKELFSVL